MRVDGKHFRSLWWNDVDSVLEIIDQRMLPYQFQIAQVVTLEEFADAISEMKVRGAPLIGATAAYGVARAMADDPSDINLQHAHQFLEKTRPTAINLRWALDRCRTALSGLPENQRAAAALQLAH